MPEFEGTSDQFNFEEALGKAVQKALETISHTEPMVSYTVKKISGLKGGLAGLKRLTVVIDADLQ
jgi:hypothetical protein